MRVLITGGAGFIGANLVQHLLDHGDDVVVLDDLSTGYASNLDGVDVEFVKGSILDEEVLGPLVAGVDAVAHLAARGSVPRSIDDPMATHQANATGTLCVLEAARLGGGIPVVMSSSSSVYGANPTLPRTEDQRPIPVSPYAVSKLAAEQYALAHQICYGLPVLPFRFFNVFGPLQAPGHAYAAVVPAFVHAALKREALPVNGDGMQSRDFTYVGTVVEVLAEALHNGVTSDIPVNLAFGARHTLVDVITEIESLIGHTVEIDRRPDRVGDVRHSQADQTRLRSLFPDIQPTSLTDGLEATVAWHRSGTQADS